ncbi:MAG: hypothetical protein RXN92_04925 [Thermoplasmatales archaeon]|jgi:hypothetical protein
MIQTSEIQRVFQENDVVLIKSSINVYTKSILELMNFGLENNKVIFYISATVPSSVFKTIFESTGLPHENIYFIDCTTYSFDITQDPNTIVVESPTMLETIIIKVMYLNKISRQNLPDKSPLIIVDSANSLAIHNDLGILSEFFHVLITMVRPTGSKLAILSIMEQLTDELSHTLELISDTVLTE